MISKEGAEVPASPPPAVVARGPGPQRGADILGAFFGLLLTAPLMGAVALTMGLTMGWPALFRQPRTGLRAGIFTLYKFRTMDERRDGPRPPAAGRDPSDSHRPTPASLQH